LDPRIYPRMTSKTDPRILGCSWVFRGSSGVFFLAPQGETIPDDPQLGRPQVCRRDYVGEGTVRWGELARILATWPKGAIGLLLLEQPSLC